MSQSKLTTLSKKTSLELIQRQVLERVWERYYLHFFRGISNDRNILSQVLYRIGVLKHFIKLTGNLRNFSEQLFYGTLPHVCSSIFSE